jgi:polyhydroxyalkanoate synthase
VNKGNPADPADWLKTAQTQQSTWWTDASAWLAERCGGQKRAPEQLGGGGLRPLVDAPGTYVFDS